MYEADRDRMIHEYYSNPNGAPVNHNSQMYPSKNRYASYKYIHPTMY